MTDITDFDATDFDAIAEIIVRDMASDFCKTDMEESISNALDDAYEAGKEANQMCGLAPSWITRRQVFDAIESTYPTGPPQPRMSLEGPNDSVLIVDAIMALIARQMV